MAPIDDVCMQCLSCMLTCSNANPIPPIALRLRASDNDLRLCDINTSRYACRIQFQAPGRVSSRRDESATYSLISTTHTHTPPPLAPARPACSSSDPQRSPSTTPTSSPSQTPTSPCPSASHPMTSSSSPSTASASSATMFRALAGAQGHMKLCMRPPVRPARAGHPCRTSLRQRERGGASG